MMQGQQMRCWESFVKYFGKVWGRTEPCLGNEWPFEFSKTFRKSQHQLFFGGYVKWGKWRMNLFMLIISFVTPVYTIISKISPHLLKIIDRRIICFKMGRN